jgi:hypothetical protein
MTVKRQLKYKEYKLKDWVVNAISLAEYYCNKFHFAQCEYLLFAALSIMPEDITKKKKLRATLKM